MSQLNKMRQALLVISKREFGNFPCQESVTFISANLSLKTMTDFAPTPRKLGALVPKPG